MLRMPLGMLRISPGMLRMSQRMLIMSPMSVGMLQADCLEIAGRLLESCWKAPGWQLGRALLLDYLIACVRLHGELLEGCWKAAGRILGRLLGNCWKAACLANRQRISALGHSHRPDVDRLRAYIAIALLGDFAFG